MNTLRMSSSTSFNPDILSSRRKESYSCCCFKIRATILDRVAHVTKGLGLLVVLWICLTLLFVAILSVSIGVSILVSILCKTSLDTSLPNEYQAIMALMVLTALSDRLYKNGSYVDSWGRKYVDNAEKWETILLVGLVYLILGHIILALMFLYFGYKCAHASTYCGDKDVKEIEPKTMNESCTFLVLFALGMFAHVVPRIMEWKQYSLRDYKINWKCCWAFIPFFFGQIVLLGIYTVPLVLLIHPCSFIQLPPGFTFFVSLILGGIVAFYATKFDNLLLKRIDDGPPYYFYENFCFSRTFLLQYILIPSVALVFYGTFGVSDLSPAVQFHLYTIFIILTVIQTSKGVFGRDYKYRPGYDTEEVELKPAPKRIKPKLSQIEPKAFPVAQPKVHLRIVRSEAKDYTTEGV